MKVLAKQPNVTENFYLQDDTLQNILKDKLPLPFFNYADRELAIFGALCAGPIDERAKHTDREGEPRLVRYNKFGEETSRVWVNEGYKQTVKDTYNTGIVGYVHKEIPELGHHGNYIYSFAQGYLLSQSEPGFYCPVTLTMATAYLLEHYADDAVKKRFMPHVCSTGDVELYEGATFLTERQGGSDVGANTVSAKLIDGTYHLYGEKYFASNAGQCGVAMVLARIEGAAAGSKGLTLFAVPWHLEDGSLNGITIRRLKDKLGVRAVPSGEVVFDHAKAYIVGDPSKGIYYMLEALNLSRICNAAASVGIMQRALQEAYTYTSARSAFSSQLTHYPVIRHSLMKLKAKHHAELVSLFDLIGLYDKVTAGNGTQEEQILVRLLIALTKKETAEQAIHFSHEAIELHGGNGYIEDFVTPRLLRDAQVLTVWEGTANILALELIRLVQKYNVQELFLQAIEQRLSLLSPCYLTEIVERKLEETRELLVQFTALDEAMQIFEAKAVMKQLVSLYESLNVVEYAKKHRGQGEQLAAVFLEEEWNLRSLGEQAKAIRYYEDIFI
ncbi:acyl-CoA dehydrogenase family protein [Lysinibacillus odysseyi]|uniref:Isovaleryl-CoA dehydrogenase n=1 Tax=Lysinibacillus odysseyi 34hs-1 = NBRC 100172 TaxID=1220589 RepID=A0A0A3IRR5_9BACI|nr:acyl-CoA dehydrogenase family protein [Lysinibacillus odysseyi]KGR87381.1 isovaleryl-CoA dehydrogenase [Lysinibacillus odysseyi 34hs-1 = NBRC 100172]